MAALVLRNEGERKKEREIIEREREGQGQIRGFNPKKNNLFFVVLFVFFGGAHTVNVNI